MELRNEFRVAVPVETAWKVLNDVERIAPCLPGAQLQEIEGNEYRGIVKVKVGPITAQYKGTATIADQDEAGGRVVMTATGRDTGGGGNANATITTTMVPDGDGTKVTVVTDLAITGKLAQFGRGVLSEVSAKLLGQFVDALERNVLDPAPEPAAQAAGAPPHQPLPDEPVLPADTMPAEPTAAEPVASTPAAVPPEPPASAAEAVPEPPAPAAAPTEPPASAAEAVPELPAPAAAPPEPPAPAAAAAPVAEVLPAEPAPQPDTPPAATPLDAPAASGNGAGPSAGPATTTVRRIDGPEVKPVDLLDAASSSLAKRVLLPLAALVALVAGVVLWQRRSHS